MNLTSWASNCIVRTKKAISGAAARDWRDAGLFSKTGATRTAPVSQPINITICRDSERNHWSLQINERWHRRITSDVLESLVEGAVVKAELTLERVGNSAAGWLRG
jgi:hypothetical protein